MLGVGFLLYTYFLIFYFFQIFKLQISESQLKYQDGNSKLRCPYSNLLHGQVRISLGPICTGYFGVEQNGKEKR